MSAVAAKPAKASRVRSVEDITEDWRETMMQPANEAHAVPLAFEAIYVIDALVEQMLDRAEEGHPSVDAARLMRVFQAEALRIKQMNLVLMNFLTGTEMTAGQAHEDVYGRMPTREGER